MSRRLECDICRKETNRIVGKVLFIPSNGKAYSYSDYSAHADIGECCASKIAGGMIRFKKRKKREKKEAVKG